MVAARGSPRRSSAVMARPSDPPDGSGVDQTRCRVRSTAPGQFKPVEHVRALVVSTRPYSPGVSSGTPPRAVGNLLHSAGRHGAGSVTIGARRIAAGRPVRLPGPPAGVPIDGRPDCRRLMRSARGRVAFPLPGGVPSRGGSRRRSGGRRRARGASRLRTLWCARGAKPSSHQSPSTSTRSRSRSIRGSIRPMKRSRKTIGSTYQPQRRYAGGRNSSHT